MIKIINMKPLKQTRSKSPSSQSLKSSKQSERNKSKNYFDVELLKLTSAFQKQFFEGADNQYAISNEHKIAGK